MSVLTANDECQLELGRGESLCNQGAAKTNRGRQSPLAPIDVPIQTDLKRVELIRDNYDVFVQQQLSIHKCKYKYTN